ncbi:hypothetical protein HDU89_008274 [Geranomyces variabilis]|nr:hypothetical protein HDU89_008274 [Geranomyces variabilis]
MSSLNKYVETRNLLKVAITDTAVWKGWHTRLYKLELPAGVAADEELLVAHERTTCVDKVLPWFSPLRITGLIQWKWCEIDYGARVIDVLAADDYTGKDTKLADGLGMTLSDGFEALVMESSGHETKEDLPHAITDSYKLIEDSTLSLRHIFASHRDASWETMRNMSTLSAQYIKNNLTLVRTSIAEVGGAYKWQIV